MYRPCVSALNPQVSANAAWWELELVMSKFKTITHLGFSTFSKMYHSYVVPFIDYSAGKTI